MHMMQHLVEDKITLFGSPMMFWCYGDEDYVGVIKGVCSMTKHPLTLEARVTEKTQIMAGITVHQIQREQEAQGAQAWVGQRMEEEEG